MSAEGKLKVIVVTPAGEKLVDACDEVIAPGRLGQFGVLHEHIDFFAACAPGVLTVVKDGKPSVYAVGKGFVEAGRDHVYLLVQSAEAAAEIDVPRAAKARQKAEAALAGLDGNVADPAWQEQDLRLRRAVARLEAAGAAGHP